MISVQSICFKNVSKQSVITSKSLGPVLPLRYLSESDIELESSMTSEGVTELESSMDPNDDNEELIFSENQEISKNDDLNNDENELSEDKE